MEETNRSWNDRNFKDSYLYLLGAELPLNKYNQKVDKVLLMTLGIRENGIAEILAYSTTGADNKKDTYMNFLSLMYDRGIRSTLIWTGPDSSEFSESVMEVYRRSDLQHCTRQKIVSSLLFVDPFDQDVFQYGIRQVFRQKDIGTFLTEMNHFRMQWKNKYSTLTDSLEENMTFLMTFFKYPELIHPYIKSSSMLHIIFRHIIAKTMDDPELILDLDSWLPSLCQEKNKFLEHHPVAVFQKISQESSLLLREKYHTIHA
jgi:putative transposase